MNAWQRVVRVYVLLVVIFPHCLTSQPIVSATPLPQGATQEELDAVPHRPIKELLKPYKFPVKKARVKGLELAYIDVGNSRSKEVLLFIHGLHGYIPIWDKIIEDLSRDYRCIAVDLPGFGRSEKGELPINIIFYADILVRFLDGLKVRDAYVVGHSMGGQIAINLGLRYASRFKKLLLIAPTGIEPFTQAERQAFYDNVTVNTTKDKTDDVLRADFARLFYKVPTDAEFMLRDRLFMRRASDYEQYCYAVARSTVAIVELPTWDMLEGVLQPTLLIFGRNDKLIPNQFFHVMQKPQDIAEYGKSKMKKCVVQMIDRCGHLAQWDNPDAVNQTIRDFLDR
ncbi:MAG: alpha/beta hydrolase [Bacteroidota bacterium]|nr:alpha/beta hydrolase [Candidatus Kapabacteria bacterium]MDW8220470.1 alpha/beta hydrolase [Bacteroidota bacterium]